MKTKNYEAPETEVVVVRIERQIMSPGGYNLNGTQKGRAVENTWSDGWDDES